MSGLFTYAIAGLGFILIGAFESLSPFLPNFSSSAAGASFRYLSAATLSAATVLNSLLSSLASLRPPPPRRDPLAVPIHLNSAAAAALFLLYSLAGILSKRLLLPIPPSLLDLLLLFAFLQEFLLFSLFQHKDPSGVENRYYDLLLSPVLVCAAATAICAARPRSGAPPRLARGLGLVLQGTWLVQMGFSFFSSAVAHGCALHERSRGDFTVKCRGHPEYHRARAVATLQFNCHLALLVIVSTGVYSAVVAGIRGGSERYRNYSPLSEMQRLDRPSSHFTLEADEEGGDEIVAEEERSKRVSVDLPVSGVNGFGGSH